MDGCTAKEISTSAGSAEYKKMREKDDV